MATSKRNKNELIYEQKREICKFNLKNPNHKQVTLCALFSKKFESTVPSATMSDIIRNNEKYLNPQSSANLFRGRKYYFKNLIRIFYCFKKFRFIL